MILIKNISKIYNKGNEDEVSALKDVSIEIPQGEFVVIIGTNGSGKSTILNLLLGTQTPTQGNILINNNDITALPEYKRSKWISMVFQNPAHGTAPELSILENFRLASLRAGKKKLSIGINDDFRKTVEEKVASLGMGLEKKLEQPMGSLSGGQRQALTLLMGVMDKTDILLMDEPTAALDPKSSQVVMQLADKINKELGITIVLVTHSMKDALHYGNRLLMFHAGAILRDLNGMDKSQLQLSNLQEWFS
ncbi:MAG: ABC transporter ATP-binding protein [Chitinophagaceae bacterium]|jgi:putative ABC transport system ATP-binding protein